MTGAELLLVPHVNRADAELIERVAARRGVRLRVVRPFAGEALPAPEDVTGAVFLGGPMAAYETDQHPFLKAEQEFMADAVRLGTPVLGICLGAQLLAAATGGRAFLGPHGLEAGYIEVTVQDHDWQHLIGPSGTRYFSFHSDTFTVPPGAALLATSARYPQAFAMGDTLGIQFHPEIGRSGVERLLVVEKDKLAAHGLDSAALAADLVRYESEAEAHGERLIGGWIDRVVQPTAGWRPTQ